MKINFKKITCLALALVATLSLAACDSGKEAASHLSSALESISTAKETTKTEESKLAFSSQSGSDSYCVEGIGSCKDEELQIPSQYKGLPVTQIVSDAFKNNSRLKSVSIPDSVTTIGDYAFYYCNKLTSVSIPDSVTTIGDCAFYYCYNLTSVSIPGSVTIINYGAFSYSGLTHVTMGEGVEVIESKAFLYCNLRSVTIPSSVVTIASNAFSDNSNLETVNYLGTMERWKAIAPYNLTKKGITVLCTDGVINY